jgi:hypothetical protein
MTFYPNPTPNQDLLEYQALPGWPRVLPSDERKALALAKAQMKALRYGLQARYERALAEGRQAKAGGDA